MNGNKTRSVPNNLPLFRKAPTRVNYVELNYAVFFLERREKQTDCRRMNNINAAVVLYDEYENSKDLEASVKLESES